MSTDNKLGKRRVKAAIAEAKPASIAPSSSNVVEWHGLGRFFKVDADGIWRDTEKNPIWVCGPMRLLAETRSSDGNGWGLLVEFRDSDGKQKQLVIPRRALAGDGAMVREMLADGGLRLGVSPPARQALLELLGQARSPTRATAVPRVGWHRVGGKLVFALPGHAIGAGDEGVFIEQETRAPNAFAQHGELADWKAKVGQLCIGNSRLALGVAAAFAAPLLYLVGAEGGGVHFRGSSRTGKTSALLMACSVWGGEAGAGAAGYLRSWKTTANALEGTAAGHSDALLPLDEIGLVDSREVGEVAYTLMGGRGKIRASRSGMVRPELRWRVLVLSTGELGVIEKNAEAGKQTRAGQLIRLIEVNADAGAGHGLFEQLHGHASGAAFSDHIRAVTSVHFGTAAMAWLEWLARRLAVDEVGFQAELMRRRDALARQLLPPGATGQVTSVASLFAVIALAGELAVEAGILDWPDDEAADAARHCFEAWIGERGTVGAQEDQQAETQLRRFIQLHGPGRFQLWGKAPDEVQDDADARPDQPPHERFRTVNRAGFRRWEPVQEGEGTRWRWVYYATSTGMNEALAGLQFRQSVASLTERGFLVGDQNGRSSQSLRPTGEPKQRLYVIADKLFSEEELDL